MPPQDKRPQSWTKEQRLDALLDTHNLDEKALGAWCREHGLHTHHLTQWRQDWVNSKAEPTGKEVRALREENRDLKKELRRKDKALAETTALLVLKKKASAIWGEPEDD